MRKGNITQSNLILAIRALGLSTADFAKEKLGINYQTFLYRVRVGKLSHEDIWRILHYTGKTYEQLFPNPYTIRPKPITLTLGPNTKPRLTPAPVEAEPEIVPVPAPQKFEPIPVIDVYGGLPPIED